ncbi:MAG: glycosyltransferase [Erythrobacter sp.]|nr:glycosyltransferase [Erythrobacter sp.]
MRILVLSNLYPDRRRPTFGTFVEAHVRALRAAGAHVDTVALEGVAVHTRVLRKYLWLAVRASWYAVVAIVRRRRPEIVEAHIAYPTALLAWPIARLMRARLVVYCHGSDLTVVAARSKWHHRAARVVLARADLLVANSEFTQSVLRSTYSVTHRRIRVWSPGIDASVFGVHELVQRNSSEVLYVGRLDPGKGLELLVEAMELVGRERASLTVIGDGSLRRQLEQSARDRRIRADFTGGLPATHVASAMARAAVLAVPSTHPEGLGLVAVEGLACGALVVAAASGGLTEVIDDGRTGWLVRPGSAAALAGAIGEALDVAVRADERTDAIRTAGYRLASRHDIFERAKVTLQTYRRLLSSSPTPSTHD